MYKIYVASGTAAMAPQAVLEEIGVAYEAIPIDIGAKQHLADEYRRLNPNGRVPTLVDGDFAMFEARQSRCGWPKGTAPPGSCRHRAPTNAPAPCSG